MNIGIRVKSKLPQKHLKIIRDREWEALKRISKQNQELIDGFSVKMPKGCR